MKVLADTSIWVDYLRHGADGSAWHLDDLLAQGDVVVCGPVVAELIGGTSARDRSALWRALESLPWAPLDQTQWRHAGEVSAQLRDRGMTVPLTDVEIAAAAADAGAAVWSHDSDFKRIAPVLPDLVLYQLPPIL
jgi:predicted nucleic acid-binding protein